MKTNTLRAKLLNCFFAFTLVFGLCIPSIGSYAYAEPTAEPPADDVAAHVEGATSQGENQSNGVSTGNATGNGVDNDTGDTGGTNNLGDGVQDNANTNDTDGANTNDNNGTDTEVATTQAEEVVPMAADSTVGGLTISGGTQNADFTVSGAGTSSSPATVVVKTSYPAYAQGYLYRQCAGSSQYTCSSSFKWRYYYWKQYIFPYQFDSSVSSAHYACGWHHEYFKCQSTRLCCSSLWLWINAIY